MKSLWLILILVDTSLAAQTQPRVMQAGATITTEDVMRRVGIIAADSMQGRATPSAGLERTAQYVASEFRRVGLRPAGNGGSYMQRFAVTRWRIDTSSVVELVANGHRGVARVGAEARYVAGGIPGEPLSAPVVLINARDTSTARWKMDVKGRIVLLLADFSTPLPAVLNLKIIELARAGPKAVIVLSNRDSATFAERLATAARPKLQRDPDYRSEVGAPVIEVHERALGPVLAAVGIDPAQLRKRDHAEPRLLPELTAQIRLTRRVLERAEVPNVVAVLEGSDSVLRHEYLVYSAHIDHIGVSPGQRDSVNNGADDNASGVAGLLELAEAFRQPGMRPRRSILFLAPSGEEDGLMGSAHFTEHPTVPLSQIMANLNMDLIGRNWPDSVIAVGLEQSDLGKTLQLVVQGHPELRMTPIADRWPEERIFYRSDHYNFARKGVPILFFTSGTHVDYHQPSDEPLSIDAEKAARLVRLLFYLGVELAETVLRPRWRPESYRQIVERP